MGDNYKGEYSSTHRLLTSVQQLLIQAPSVRQGKGTGTQLSQAKISPSSDATGEELPYSRHQLSISVSCSLSFPANSYFLKQHF